MDYPHSQKEAAEYSQLALSLMDDHGIAPHPNNYAVWYNYFWGAFPDLRRSLDILLNADQPLTEARNADVYRRFCASPYEAVPLHLMAEQLEVELTTVLALLEQAGKGAARYGETLEAMTGEIASVENSGGLRQIVSRLLRETRSMVGQSRDVEKRLQEASNDVGRLTEELERSRREALTDPLTGLANRSLFEDLLRQETKQAMTNGTSISLLLIDVDHFKRVNDTYGHQVGDQVLKLLATILKNSLKGRDTAARCGGEEFAVILPETPLEGAVAVAQAIRDQVAAKAIVHRKSGEKLGQVTVSIGATQFQPGEALRQLIERADGALYKAKSMGRNRVISETELSGRDFALVS